MNKYTPQPRNVAEWLQRLKYWLHRLLVTLLQYWAIPVFCVGVGGWMAFWCSIESSQSLWTQLLLGSAGTLCLSMAGGCLWFLWLCDQAPKGHLLNPVESEELPILTSKEVLVRPSSSADAQPAELLRATREEGKPEELLRASVGEQP